VSEPTDAGRRTRTLRRLPQLGAVGLVAALLGLLAWSVLDAQGGSSLRADVQAGERPSAPSFSLAVIWERVDTWPSELVPTLADGRVSLRELHGYPVVINFWASWCEPCKDEAPILAASATAHAGEVIFLGLDVKDFKSDARRFLARYDVNYVSVRDSSDDTYSAYGLTGIPETFYVDRDGRVVDATLGELSREELERGIAAAFESR
jgi:cytochrome c biogenesis protein CcmG/thiol:disulfide interchange protein DsbE